MEVAASAHLSSPGLATVEWQRDLVRVTQAPREDGR